MGKKRQPILSNLDRNLMVAYNYENISAAKVKQFKAQVRSHYKDVQQSLDFTGSPAEQITVTEKNINLLYRLQSPENDPEYLSAIRALVLGYWDEHRVVYRASKDLLDFLDKDFRIDLLNWPVEECLFTACNKPIYLEVMDGKDKLGLFISRISLINRKYNVYASSKTPAVLSFLIFNNECLTLQLSSAPAGVSFREFFDNTAPDGGSKRDEKFQKLFKVLAYIGYAQQMQDGVGTVLLPSGTKSYDYYDVVPIPYKDSIPDLTSPAGWIPSGLCTLMGFLSRRHMRDRFEKDLQTIDIDHSHIFEIKSDLNDIDVDSCLGLAQRMALEWESNKVVFQFNDEVFTQLIARRSDELLQRGFDDSLMSQFPYSTFALSNTDTGDVFLVSTCNVMTEGRVKFGVFMVALTSDGMDMAYFPSGLFRDNFLTCVSKNRNMSAKFAYITTITLFHVLSVFEQRAIKRFVKEQLTSGNPELGELVPVVDAAPRNKAASPTTPPPYHMSYEVIDEAPITLLDLTPRTVKRVPTQQVNERVGWHMRPHVRRGHTHHYWVGSGEDRHLVARTLRPMYINCAPSSGPVTTVHNLKVKC